MPSPILDVRGLKKRFGALEVLKGIDFAVAAQELVFVIGPSGSGKSTLLRCCNRLEEPDGGVDPRRRRRSDGSRDATSTPCAVASAWCSSPSTSTRT